MSSKNRSRTLARERRDDTISSLPTAFTGRGGSSKKGGSSSAGTTPDTLFSTSTIRIVGLIGEGEIGGVVGGLMGVYRNDTPIQNADGTFNFKGITCEFRTGTGDQPYMEGYPDVESARNIGVKVNQATPVVATVSDENVNRVRVTVFIPALFIQKNDGTYQANSVSYRINCRFYNGTYASLGEFTVTGKTTSGYYRQHELSLPKNSSGDSAPWQVQVVRLSPDTDGFNNSQSKYTVQSDLIFYSITDLIDSKLTYPWSALVGMTAQTSQLGDDLGEFRVLTDGLRFQVPSNRNQANRTYDGFWDGTFKEEVADSPPWFLYALMENDRFGLGEFLETAGLDKVTLYEIGRYCDTLVDDGAGGREPRYTINAEISTQEEAYDLLQLVAQIYHGMVYWSSGAVTSTWDAPRDPKFLATEANVVDGTFTYSSSARKARHTAALVKWHDPSNLYRENIEFVELGEAIARYGYNPITVDLLGCTSRGQAHRHGLWTLLTETYETQVVKFQGGMEYALARPGDLVSVQDPQISNLDYGGRLLAGSTSSQLRLDRPITLKAGVDFLIEVTTPDGTVSERGISSVSTDDRGRAIVSLSNQLEFTPDSAVVWQISGDIVPQLFRIVTITESQPHIYDVTGLQYEPGKYAAVDDGAPLIPEPISEFPNIVLPPTNLAVRESQYMSNGSAREALTLSWTAGQPFNSVGYYVTIVRPTGEVVNFPRTASTSIDILDAGPGDYRFIVVAIGLNGRTSLPAELTYTASGWAGVAAPSILGLQVKGGGSVFRGRSCTVEWSKVYPGGQDPYTTRCVVYIFDPSTNYMLHREMLPAGVNEFTYDYNVNVNEGGPRRAFRVQVTAMTPDEREGVPASLLVSNPAPAKVSPQLTWTTESVVVDTPRPDDLDFDGFLIWMSKTKGFVPTDTNVTVDTLSTSAFIRADSGTRYYVRVAAYDSFSKRLADLNLSDELSVSTNTFPIDVNGPDQPTGLTLSTASETSSTGVTTSTITATWNPVTSENLAQYQFELVEGDGTDPLSSWMRELTAKGVSKFTWRGVKPGILHAARVRGVNGSGYWGAYSQIVTIVSAKNANKPGPITNFSVTATPSSAILKWTNPTDPDYAYAEIRDQSNGAPGVLLEKAGRPSTFWADTTLLSTATRSYYIRSVNTSETPGDWVGPISATLPQIQAAALANGIIDATKVAASLSVPAVVTSLPATGVEGVSLAVMNGELYRFVGGAWTKAVKSTDIAGQILANQIKELTAAQITGQLSDSQILGLSAAKVSGQLTSAQIASIDAAKAVGDLVNATLASAKLTGQVTSDQIASLTAAKLAGQITSTQITDNAITTPKIAAGAVVANSIAAGAITTSKLSVTTANFAQNADMVAGTQGFVPSGSSWGGTGSVLVSTYWIAEGMSGLYGTCTGGSGTNGTFDITHRRVDPSGSTRNFTCNAGQLYEVSCYYSAHRCQMGMYVCWVNSAGTWFATSGFDGASFVKAGGAMKDYPRAVIIDTAPAGAVGFFVIYRGRNVTGDNPVIAPFAMMYAAATAGATEASPYIPPSVVTIDGNSITVGTVYGSRLVARTISADRLIAGTVTANEIAANTITAAQIAASTITATQIAAGTLTAREIATGAITTSKLAVSSINLAYNGDLRQGLAGWGYASDDLTGFTLGLGQDSSYAPDGFSRAYVYIASGTVPAGRRLFVSLQSSNAARATSTYPVNPGQTYEISAAYSSSFPTNFINFVWIDSNGGYISESYGAAKGAQGQLKGPVSTFPRIFGIATAPANAAKVWLRFGFYNAAAASTSGNMGVSAVMFAPALAGQTEASPYVDPGITTIDGGNVLTGSLSADRIIARTISADRLIAGTLTANEIAAKTITGDKIAANTITAGLIQAGAVGADQIAAGAIVADKIGVGLNSTNLIYNSDLKSGGAVGQLPAGITWYTNDTPSSFYVGINQAGGVWEPTGLRSLQASCPSSPTGTFLDVYFNTPALSSTFTSDHTVLAGRRYEASVYLSTHRCKARVLIDCYDQSGKSTGLFYGSYVDNNPSQGQLSAWARSSLFFTTPANTATVRFLVRTEYYGGSQPYTFISGAYLAPAGAQQSQLSDWSVGSSTLITGAGIVARTITADRLIANSITANEIASATITGDRIAANTITGTNIQANSIYADRIQIGGGQALTTWMGGVNNTQINGGAIAANTISANKLTVGLRGVNIVGLNLRYTVATRRIEWDAGSIYTIDDNNTTLATNISAGGFQVTGNNYYAIVWNKGNTYLESSIDMNFTFYNTTYITLATYDNGTGLAVYYGGTIIDGARIITGSITAGQIAAGTIQASNIAAGAITAEKIGAGQVTADKISGGTISGGTIFLSDNSLFLESYSGRPRITCVDRSNNIRVMLGNTTGFSPYGGDWGLVVWDNNNNVILAPSGVNGGGIWANSITANQLSTGTLITTSAQIGSATVGTLQILDSAISQVVSGSSSSSRLDLYVTVRSNKPISMRYSWGGSNGQPSDGTQPVVGTFFQDQPLTNAYPLVSSDRKWSPYYGEIVHAPGPGTWKYSVIVSGSNVTGVISEFLK